MSSGIKVWWISHTFLVQNCFIIAFLTFLYLFLRMKNVWKLFVSSAHFLAVFFTRMKYVFFVLRQVLDKKSFPWYYFAYIFYKQLKYEIDCFVVFCCLAYDLQIYIYKTLKSWNVIFMLFSASLFLIWFIISIYNVFFF